MRSGRGRRLHPQDDPGVADGRCRAGDRRSSDPDPLVRMNAALALLALKEDARPAVPDLIAGAVDEDNDTNLDIFTMTIRQAVLQALGAAAAGTDAAVPTLSAGSGWSRPEHMTKAAAAWGLGLAGSHARETAPAMRALLRDPDPDVRYAAEEALARIGAERNGPVRAHRVRQPGTPRGGAEADLGDRARRQRPEQVRVRAARGGTGTAARSTPDRPLPRTANSRGPSPPRRLAPG